MIAVSPPGDNTPNWRRFKMMLRDNLKFKDKQTLKY